jgi:hypothetical protein
VATNMYCIWDQVSRSFVGGAQPLLYPVSADATAQANGLTTKSQAHEKQPKPSFSVITVTVP